METNPFLYLDSSRFGESESAVGTGITAIVTAFRRTEKVLATLSRIRACLPPPDELLVHVDGNELECVSAVRVAFPELRILTSEARVGPGGARNRLISEATNEMIASFDDDSYPIDADYFARLKECFARFSEAAVISSAIYHRFEPVGVATRSADWVSDFVGCGCAFRRSVFLRAGRYLPLPVAYGMEEVDLALRLRAKGERVVRADSLRVFHDTDLRHHQQPEVTAASIANVVLLAYLRYPPALWSVGLAQCLNRVLWLGRSGRWRGIVAGFKIAPGFLRQYRSYRERVPASAIWSYLALRQRRGSVVARLISRVIRLGEIINATR